MVAIGVDIGGTFTDVMCLVEGSNGSRLLWTKEPSTRDDPVRAVVRGTKRILDLAEIEAAQIRMFLHGTTVATNAVLERRGARIGVLLTAGFESTLDLGRGHHSQPYRLDPHVETPTFLAPPRRCVGVSERIAADGSEVLPLAEEEVLAGVRFLLEEEHVEALAVCYLFSFVNPQHELRTRSLVEETFPGLQISLSHQVDPEFREYERACLTALDAYLRPTMNSYLSNLSSQLSGIGVTPKVLTMQSRGGVGSTEMAIERPITTLLSGPAAGVVAAERVAAMGGFSSCITLDMGGTSADISLISEGRSLTTTSGKLGSLPLRIPMVDVSTIGAGGGSIAWLDDAGTLRVGPQSAGAAPGPACYGRGGRQATVTDASVVLGYIAPEHFAGGITLDAKAAWDSIEELAAPLGISVPAAAAAIHLIVNAKMADQIRLVSVNRGYDVRDFALVLFGGGGPVNGSAVAEELGINQMVVPFAPGALCAYGLLAAKLEYDSAQTNAVRLSDADPVHLERAYRDLDSRARERLAKDGVDLDSLESRRAADLRYVGQSYELEVPIADMLDDGELKELPATFHRLYERRYGHVEIGPAIELTTLRMVHSHDFGLAVDYVPATASADKVPASRSCSFDLSGEFVPTAVFERSQLSTGDGLDGPAVIHQADTTIVVGPQFHARIDANGNVVMERKA